VQHAFARLGVGGHGAVRLCPPYIRKARAPRITTPVLTRRGLRLACRRREQRQERPLDRRLPGRSRDLRAGQVGHVEHVDDPLAERRHMRRGDVEVELRQRGDQFVARMSAATCGEMYFWRNQNAACRCAQTAVRRAARLRGFFSVGSGDTRIKVALGRPVTFENWPAVARQTRRRTG
jgi:hypothetical protein